MAVNLQYFYDMDMTDFKESLNDLTNRYERFRLRCVSYGGLEPSNAAGCYEALSYLKAQPQAAAAASLMPDALKLLDELATKVKEGAAARKGAACNSDVHEQPSGDLVGHPPSSSEISDTEAERLYKEHFPNYYNPLHFWGYVAALQRHKKPVSVEVAAKALFKNNKHTVHEGFFTRQITWEELAEAGKEHLRNDARAVLDAAGVKYVD